MGMQPPNSIAHVTAAVVNYNGEHLLDACLRSLVAQEGARLEILFIDNASSDNSIHFVRSRYPQARIVANAGNLGYNAALNQAVDLMQGDYLLALNTDIHLEPDYCARLADCITRRRARKCGYAQGKIKFMKEDGERTNRFYSTGHLFCLNRIVYNRGSGQEDAGQYDREERIPGANAACLLLSRKMLEDMRTELGVFDPLFFMYGGDVDFDWLAACRGWTAWYCPEALAYHVGEASSGISKKGYDAPFINCRFLMMIKNDRLPDVLIDLPRLVKRNVQDVWNMTLRNPSLAWRLPIHLIRNIAPALRSRRATRHLRQSTALRPREWMKWSLKLLRKSEESGLPKEKKGTGEEIRKPSEKGTGNLRP